MVRVLGGSRIHSRRGYLIKIDCSTLQNLKRGSDRSVVPSKQLLEVTVRCSQNEYFQYEDAKAVVSRCQDHVPLPEAHDPKVSAGLPDYNADIDGEAVWNLFDFNADFQPLVLTVLKAKLSELLDAFRRAKYAVLSTSVIVVDLARAHFKAPFSSDSTVSSPLQFSAALVSVQADFCRFTSKLSQLEQKRSVLQGLANRRSDELVQVCCQLQTFELKIELFCNEVPTLDCGKEFIGYELDAISVKCTQVEVLGCPYHDTYTRLVKRLDEEARRTSALFRLAEAKGEEDFKRYFRKMAAFARDYGGQHDLDSQRASLESYGTASEYLK